MTIPANQLAIINAGQTQIANAKTALAALVSGGDSMMAIAAGLQSAQLILYTQKHRAKAGELLRLVEQWHSDLGFDLIAQYGADGTGIVTQGGGGR